MKMPTQNELEGMTRALDRNTSAMLNQTERLITMQTELKVVANTLNRIADKFTNGFPDRIKDIILAGQDKQTKVLKDCMNESIGKVKSSVKYVLVGMIGSVIGVLATVATLLSVIIHKFELLEKLIQPLISN
jgi:hypothetical protein